MPGRVQIPGQVFGEAGGQLADLAQQNGSSLSSQASYLGGTQRSWHTDTDIYQLRQFITEKILDIFRGPISLEWQQRLPNLVRRLEGALFMEAASKEEYVNLNTLERRLTSLMRRFQHNRNQSLSHHNPHVGTLIPTPGLQQSGNAGTMIHNRNQSLSHHNPHVGTLIPTPGLQQIGNVGTMIPTPGTDISLVNGHGTSTMVPNTVGMEACLPNSNSSSAEN